MSDRYDSMFAGLRAKREGAFGAFAMLGDPDLDASANMLEVLVEAGADMLEVGIPFSDPIADGPVIQAAATRALTAGMRTHDCFALLAAFRARHRDIPVGILCYANLVVARGADAFYRAAAQAGVDSVLVADVPINEAAPFIEASERTNISPVLIAAANTPEHRLRDIARSGGGYTYCVARAGVTGADETVRLDHARMLQTLRESGAPPAIFGFGISRPDHVRAALDAGAAGVIVGSAIVERSLDGPEAVARFVRDMKHATRQRET